MSSGRCLGSPPRMRGKPVDDIDCYECTRITPADAGKTMLYCGCRSTRQDHPRGCGENTVPPVGSAMLPGSPPRMRGKPPRVIQWRVKGGITPADAGKTALYAKWDGMEKDHPRGCGENPVTAAVTPLKPGSPPRMRGKPFQRGFDFGFQGITPADAGKTT